MSKNRLKMPKLTYLVVLGLSFVLHLHPYFMLASSEGSGETAQCPDSPEHLLLDNAIRTKISCAGSFNYTVQNFHLLQDFHRDNAFDYLFACWVMFHALVVVC